MAQRPAKTLRLVYQKDDPNLNSYLMLLGNPSEVRIGVSDKTFLSVREDGISISPGMAQNLNFQAMSHNMRYGGMLMDLPFPMSLIPSTPITPMPQQIMAPPLAKIVGFISDLSAISSMLVM